MSMVELEEMLLSFFTVIQFSDFNSYAVAREKPAVSIQVLIKNVQYIAYYANEINRLLQQGLEPLTTGAPSASPVSRE